MSKDTRSLPARLREHPVIASILLLAAFIGATSTILATTSGSLCWLRGGGKGCSEIKAQIFSPTPYMFDASENRQVFAKLMAMDGVRADVNLDLHQSAGPGRSFLRKKCPDIDFDFDLKQDSNGQVHIPLFIGKIEAELPGGNYAEYVKDVSCIRDFVHLNLPEDQLIFSSTGGGTSTGANYYIRGSYLINLVSWTVQARRYYEINLK